MISLNLEKLSPFNTYTHLDSLRGIEPTQSHLEPSAVVSCDGCKVMLFGNKYSNEHVVVVGAAPRLPGSAGPVWYVACVC